MRTIAEINADIRELKDKLDILEAEKREVQTKCEHKWERHNFVIDGDCIQCSICGMREKWY